MISPLVVLGLGLLGSAVFLKLVVAPGPQWQWTMATACAGVAAMLNLKSGFSFETVVSFPIAVLSGLAGFLLLEGGKRISIGQNGATMEVRMWQSTREESRATTSVTGLAKVAGMTELKDKLMEAVAEAVQVGDKQLRNGILLHGEPGNGKTFIVEALAEELGIPLLSMTIGDIASKYMNETPGNILKLMLEARQCAPCIVFLDEVDSALSKRSGGDSDSGSSAWNKESDRITNTLLTQLVSNRGTGVIMVAATNFIAALDHAAIREGRFDFKIEVTAPDESARLALLSGGFRKHAPGVTVPLEVIQSTAKRWKGFNVKRILAVTEQVPVYCRRTGKTTLAYDDIKAVLREVQGTKASAPEGTKSLDQLVLPDGKRSELRALAVRLQRSFEIEQAGGTIPNGLLFSGPPGTGKTETARALARASEWAFLPTSGNDLIGDPSKIDKIWREAMNLRPAIIFIDEADDLLASRDTSPTRSVTNKFLTVMDGAGGKVADLLWIAATNHPEAIDGAALRGGRFTEKVEFVVPDAQAMAPWISNWLAVKGWRSEMDADAIARELDGQSMANVTAVLEKAINEALTADCNFATRVFTRANLSAAIRSVVH